MTRRGCLWESSTTRYTSSLTDSTNVTSTLQTYESLNAQGHGSVYNESLNATFNHSHDSTDTLLQVKTPIARDTDARDQFAFARRPL